MKQYVRVLQMQRRAIDVVGIRGVVEPVSRTSIDIVGVPHLIEQETSRIIDEKRGLTRNCEFRRELIQFRLLRSYGRKRKRCRADYSWRVSREPTRNLGVV